MNIKIIADICGVSVATVSRVINNNGNVKEETKKFVSFFVGSWNFFRII